MALSLVKTYVKSEYQEELESSINFNLSSISSNLSSVSGDVTILQTLVNEFSVITVNKTITSSIYTLSLSSYRNFEITVTETADATLMISDIPTSSGTILDVNLKLTFTKTASITYTGTITWSLATAPNPTAVGTFLINMKSFDAGVKWYASYTGLY